MSRYSLRQTPRKKELFEGMVETPARRSTRRKSQFPADADGDTSSAAESDAPVVAAAATKPRRRGIPKFVEHIDETEESEAGSVVGSESSPLASSFNPAEVGEAGLRKRIKEEPTENDATPKKPGPRSNGSTGAAAQEKGKSKGKTEGELAVDGWRPGLDHRIDYSGVKEFGGSLGTGAMMVGFPTLMYYMWIGATYYNGKAPTPAPGQSWEDFARHMANLVYTGAFPHAKAWAMYWVFFVFEMALYCLAPGIWGKGKPLPHEGGKQLDYYCSGVWSWYITMAAAAGLHFSGAMPLYTIIDEFGPIMSVAILSGFLVSIVAYFSAILRGKQHRMTGSFVYDFFMGAELNPRMFGILDFKMFFEVRLPWYILFLTTCGLVSRQYDRYGYVSGEACFLLMAHFLYANACSKGEELIITTWDMYYEKWGFMLIFWNLAGVPLTYCHCTIFLANHHPDEYRWNRVFLAFLFVAYLFVYWVWDSCNSQKNRFRAMERGHMVVRKAFPQVPWQTLHNPRTIPTSTGSAILADGWYGLARKVHYSCDAFFAITWGLVTGFESPFPWFYPVFFCGMIAHRAHRDIQRCRTKYGDAWLEYEKMVPYLFIPYLF